MAKNIAAMSLRLKQYSNKIVKSKKVYSRKNKPVGRNGDAQSS